MNKYIEEAKRVLKIEAEAISSLIERVNETLITALDIMYSCRGKVVVTGMGKSGLIGKKIAATLSSTGTSAFFLNPAEGSHGDIGMVTKEDVVIAISNSGDTEEIINILPVLKRLGVKIISMTGNPESILARKSDVVLDISVKEEACSMGLAPTASTTATLAMGDVLAVTLLSRKGFTEEDFAFCHPGGNIGRRLLLSVNDLMHTGDSIPSVENDTLVKDAILEISSKRLGVTTVVDAEGRFIGVITDGDLRRGLEKWDSDILSMKAVDVMTADPKTITGDILATRAVSIMENNSITSLIVLGDSGVAVGIIHMHDLLQAGIV
jgi:arabinose-5-phosphate isomerase